MSASRNNVKNQRKAFAFLSCLSVLFSSYRRRAATRPPASRPPERGAQLAFGRTDLSVLQGRLQRGNKKLTYLTLDFLIHIAHSDNLTTVLSGI